MTTPKKYIVLYYYKSFNSYTRVFDNDDLESAIGDCLFHPDESIFHAIYEYEDTISFWNTKCNHYKLVKSIAGKRCSHYPSPLDNCYISINCRDSMVFQ